MSLGSAIEAPFRHVMMMMMMMIRNTPDEYVSCRRVALSVVEAFDRNSMARLLAIRVGFPVAVTIVC